MVAVNSWSFGLTGHSSARPRFHWTDASAMSQNKIQTLAVVLIDSWQQSGWPLDSQVVRLLFFFFFSSATIFVKICMRGARRSPPAYRQANNCTHFSSVKTFVFSYADYSLCIFWVIWMPYMSAPPCPLAFFFLFFFVTTLREGRPFGFGWKGKRVFLFFFFFFCYLALKREVKWWCSIFLDKYTNEVFLVWWFCTISNISGTISSVSTQQPLQISHLAAKKKLLFVISVKSLLLTRSWNKTW